MSEKPEEQAAIDVGAYCRNVEDHLTRVNGGHLVRIVGPGFDLVRGWAQMGIRLSVVYRGVEQKADRAARPRRRHPGRPSRPLRIEFCEADVIDLFESWRRAVGCSFSTASSEPTGPTGDAAKRGPSLTKHLARVVERLGRVVGLTDLPEPVRESLTSLIQTLSDLRDEAKRMRRGGLDRLTDRLARLDLEMMTAIRRSLAPDLLTALAAEAAQDLAPFRLRLPPAAWQQALDVTVDHLLRDRFGLPTILMRA